MFSNPNTYDNPRQGVRQPSFSNPTSFADTQGRGFPQYSTNNRQSSDEDTPPGQQYRNYEENSHTFKVMVRVRPALPRELESGQLVSTVQANNDKKRLTIYEYYNIDASDPDSQAKYLENTNMFTTHNFTFDNVFSPNSTQAEVYEHTAKPAVMSVLQGYNATILAYGQTGTGKTYSMEGFKFNCQDNQRGIIPRSMEEIFKYIENVSNSRTTFMVRVSYLQIYNEVISDLLRTDRSNMHIREDKKKGVFVEGLSEWAVRSPNEIYSLIQKGALSRATAATKMNDLSSRSHAVFIIIVEQMVTSQDAETGEEIKDIRVGKLNLVDLAGSERVRVTGATGKRLEECKKINQSLSALGNVISALADMKQSKTHIPYRDSKITRLLEDSLGGNCITTMMAMISPTVESFGESLSTLKFANRAKNIKNAPIINEDVDQKALLRKYEAELKKLRSELDARNRGQNDKSVMQLEEDKKRAERDKVAAFQALEAQSKEFIQEREEKKKLEEKIGSMFSQMLVGGKKMEETPQFRTAIEQQQKIIRQQYENRLQDLEKERHAIEEDKAQVDRYKQLLLKQRDIMIALTTRLNERDETIVQLQEELDAYDRIHKENEEHLEIRDKRIYELASTLKEHDIPLPKDSIGETEITGSILKNFSSNITGNEQQRYSVTQCEVVDNLQLQGDTEAAQAIETLKAQLASAQDRARRAEDEQSKLKDKLAQKDELLKNLQRQTNQGSGQESLVLMHKEIKANVDYIIESLSSQNEPQRLQAIARDLLNLQTLVNSAVAVTSSANTSGSPNSTASRSRGGNSGEAQSAGLPAEEKPEHQRSLSINRASSDKVPEQRLSINTRQASSKSNLGDNETLKEQSENVIKPHTSQPSPLRGGDAKRSTDLRSLENKRSISTGIFGKYMGSLVNVESEKKAALTAEELLKVKKEQPAPKKKV